MRKVIESELGEPLDEVVRGVRRGRRSPPPRSARSTARALHDGRDVAVKVQYPGVAQAVRADMQNLGMILRLMKRIAPGLDVKATAEEIRARIGDELDYELEAQNQRSLARIFRGHPFIVVPDVVTSLSREKVLVTEFVTGAGFDAIKEIDQATRDRVGEIVFRFFFGCMYRHHQFSGDPHPGNFLLMADGTRRVPRLRPVQGDAEGADRDRARLPARRPRGRRRASSSGSGPRPASSRSPDRFRPDKLLAQFLDATWWYVLDEEIELEPEIATQVMIDMSDPRSRTSARCATRRCPPTTCSAAASRCSRSPCSPSCARARNFHRIAREWMYGDAAGDRARPPGGRVLRAAAARLRPPGSGAGSSSRAGRTAGPAVMPTRSPGLTQPSSTTRAAAARISSSVTS